MWQEICNKNCDDKNHDKQFLTKNVGKKMNREKTFVKNRIVIVYNLWALL